jgi:hypothetical protein
MATIPKRAITATNPPHDAIIFLPGLSRQWNDQSLELIACKIAVALDRRYGRLRFTSEGRYDTINGKKAKICTISMQRDRQDPPKPVIDVYELDYYKSLTQSFENRTILGKSVMMFIAIFTNLPRVLSALFNVRRKSKTAMDKLQALYAICIFLILSAYMVLLLIAALGSASQLVQPAAGGAAEPWLLTLLANIGAHIAPFVVILTLVIVSLREKVLQFIVCAATDYVSLLNYMDFGERQNVIAGQLETFLDKLAEQANTPYRNYHIFAYSFGSIVALDTLFTFGMDIGEQTRHIDTLVTIGSPFDLIRAYWPDYFKARVAVPGVPRRGINLYSALDLLGSNFRNDPQQADAEPHIHCPAAQSSHLDGIDGGRIDPKPSDHDNIPYEQVMQAKHRSLFGLLTLQGLKVHSLYWEPSHEEERNCFSYILPRMYDADFNSLMTDPLHIQEIAVSA